MRIGIISDTHDNLPQFHKAIDFFNDSKVSLVLHAGDIISPFCMAEFERLKCPVIVVFGNNDGEKRLWYERIKTKGEIFPGAHEFIYEGVRFLMTHSLDEKPEEIASLSKYDVVIYGHSHKIEEQRIGSTLFINPGEAGGWVSGKSTVVLLEIPKKTVKFVTL